MFFFNIYLTNIFYIYYFVDPDQRCKRGRITYDLHQISINQTVKLNQSHEEDPNNTPRCHNYL
jgi:hypothetical protein